MNMGAASANMILMSRHCTSKYWRHITGVKKECVIPFSACELRQITTVKADFLFSHLSTAETHV